MANITIKQGDSRIIWFNLKVNGVPLTPDMVEDIEIYVGEDLRLTASSGEVKYDTGSQRWFIWPTQEQTFALDEGSHKVEIRRKYRNGTSENVIGYELAEKIKVKGATSREVL